MINEMKQKETKLSYNNNYYVFFDLSFQDI